MIPGVLSLANSFSQVANCQLEKLRVPKNDRIPPKQEAHFFWSEELTSNLYIYIHMTLFNCCNNDSNSYPITTHGPLPFKISSCAIGFLSTNARYMGDVITALDCYFQQPDTAITSYMYQI